MVPRCRTCGSPTWLAALSQQRQLAGQQAGLGQVVVAGQRADRDVGTIGPDVAELGEPADVHQHLGHGQPQLHQRQQGMPAGQELRVIAAVGGQGQGLIHRAGPLIAELRRDQRTCSSLTAAAVPAPASLAARMARTML